MRIQLVVTRNPRLGIDLVKDTQHLVEGLHLLGGSAVLVPYVCRKTSTTFITDSDAVRIEALYVTTSFCNRTAVIQGSVPTDVDMIVCELSETACPMSGHEFLDGGRTQFANSIVRDKKGLEHDTAIVDDSFLMGFGSSMLSERLHELDLLLALSQVPSSRSASSMGLARYCIVQAGDRESVNRKHSFFGFN